MSLQELSENISEIEVTNISSHGIWLLTKVDELFLSYENFPWFFDAPELLGNTFLIFFQTLFL